MKAEATVTRLPAIEMQNKIFPVLLKHFSSKTNEQINKQKITPEDMRFCQSFYVDSCFAVSWLH